MRDEKEEVQLRETALKNAESILAVRQRAEHELLATRDALERKTEELGRLAAAIEFSDDAIITKSLEGVIVTWNGGAERTFGYSSSEAIGRPVTILIPEDHLDEEPNILSRLRRGERIDHYETIRKRKDGTLINISLSISPIKDASGRIIGAAKIARDITRHKRIQEALTASDRRFGVMADSAPVLIWMSDSTKACTWFNRPWLQFTGRELKEEQGFGWMENVHLEDLDRCMQTYTTHFDAREACRLEYRLRRHDGAWRWVISTAVPLLEGPAQSFSGYIGSCIDVTEFKQAADEREALLQSERAARTEAERLGRLKDEFLATLSHELRTPLNAILGWATLLRRLPPGSADHTKGLETIERNSRVQAQIIGDLLDMSRIISGKVQLDVQWVSLNEVINAAIDAIRPSVDAKRLRLRATLDAKLSPIRGDPNRLQQVLWNLLTNAVKFTPPNGRVDIVLERINSHVEISVEDSGIGIKPEFLAFVFDRFRQADASTTRQHGGLGLGLSIVKHLVELHGGTVRVKSPGEGRGTTFVVALPVSVIRMEDSDRHERPRFDDMDLFSLELPSLAGATVLVVDDESDSRTLVGRLIEERGGVAILAGGADEALDVLSRERVSIIVSDVGMPEQDGYAFIRQIRKANLLGSGRVPAIALTAYARAEDRQRALLAGYQMHLAKPIEPRELIAGIASLITLPSAQQ
jgi:PAS domain S-box-containing protein